LRKSFLVAAAAMLSVACVQKAQAYDYMAVGVGTMPCKYWLSTPQLEGEGNTWILGWWTGLNSRNDDHWVGGRTDGNGIILSVKRECRRKPNKLLMHIVDEVFSKMGRAGN
jgi:hypothetical protein